METYGTYSHIHTNLHKIIIYLFQHKGNFRIYFKSKIGIIQIYGTRKWRYTLDVILHIMHGLLHDFKDLYYYIDIFLLWKELFKMHTPFTEEHQTITLVLVSIRFSSGIPLMLLVHYFKTGKYILWQFVLQFGPFRHALTQSWGWRAEWTSVQYI